MGKKYIIEIRRLERLYKAFVGAHGKPEITWLSPEVDLTPYTEPDLEQVREEAYAEGFKDGQYAERNGLVANYEQERETIQVGDEVKDDKDDIGVCTEISYPANSMHIMYADGTATDISLTGVTKTGKHFPELVELLRKMKEGS